MKSKILIHVLLSSLTLNLAFAETLTIEGDLEVEGRLDVDGILETSENLRVTDSQIVNPKENGFAFKTKTLGETSADGRWY